MSRRQPRPSPPVAQVVARLTEAEIEAARGPRGGWTRETFHNWGIPWPPQAGWKTLLTGQSRPLGEAERTGMVTIITDASFLHQHKVGGWAAWVKADNVPGVFHSGTIPICQTSMEAEMRALAEGLDAAIRTGVVKTGHRVMLQSDCDQALAVYLGLVDGVMHSQGLQNSVPIKPARKTAPSVRNSHALVMMRRAVATHQLRIIVRHVRGHVAANTSGRTEINRMVDKMAKREARSLLKPQETECEN